MNITVYSTTTCPWCSELKEYLGEKGLPFVEKYVDTDEVAKEEMRVLSGGFLGVPFTVIEDTAGTKDMIIGFDRGKLDQILSVKQQ